MDDTADRQLVLQAQRGDTAAFAELFSRYEGPIFGYLYRMVGNRSWAEDLAQESFIRAHQNLGRLGPPYNFKSWVYRIAGNLALDGLRQYRHEVPLPDWDAGEATMPEPAGVQPDPEHEVYLSDVRSAIWRTLHQLPDSYRQILLLRELDGLSYREIAATLDISLDNVKVTLHRARLQFQDVYQFQEMMASKRMECHALDALISAEVDGELDRATRRKVEAHISSCPTCRRTRQNLLAVSSLLAALAPVFPPPSLRSRFLTRLQHLPPPEPPPPPPARPPARTPDAHSPRQSGRSLYWILFTGGVGLLILLIGLILLLLLPRAAGFVLPPTLTPFVPSPVSSPVRPTATAHPGLPPAASAIATLTPLPPTVTTTRPPPTSTPTPTSTPRISFWVDDTTVPAGQCTAVRWETANVQAVFLDGNGVPGVGSLQTCPCTPENHTLDVLLRDGTHDVRSLTVQVTGSCVTPTPTPPDTQPPPVPQAVAPTGGAVLSCRTTTRLTWDTVEDPSGVSGYFVRLQQDAGSRWLAAGEWGPLSTTQVDVDVDCGYGYRWSVQAEDGSGNPSSWSAWAEFGIGID
jgi:RNA polymerase sigma-70 factor (ECF subfamily)